MPKALIIITQEGFQDYEYSDTKEVLDDNGVETITASITTDKAQGNYGLIVMPEIAVKDAKADDYDVIVLIGGPGALNLANHQEVLDLIREAKFNNIKLAAICIAPVILAKAGVLEGKRATVWKSVETLRAFQNAKVIFIDKPVHVENNLVTGNGPSAAREFGQ